MKVTKPIYVAHCIEYGDRFLSLFQTNETNKNKLYDMGQEHASGWGAECIKVTKWKPKVTRMVKYLDKKTGEWQDGTVRRWNNFIKKNPNNTRYDYPNPKYFEITEPTPTDVWDNDHTSDENLAGKELSERV